MASQKQIEKWSKEAEKINDNPKYIQAYVEYKRLAKRADQRLVRLEALSHEKHFEGVLEFAYKTAIRDIRSWGGDKRFNTAPPVKLTELEAKIADIKKFVRPDNTSTKLAILKIYKKRADTINKRYAKEFGVEFTWEDIANYYSDASGKRASMQLASKTEVRVLAVIKKMATAKNIKDIQDTQEKIQHITGKDKILAKEVERLTSQGLDYNKLMGGN